MNLRTLAHAKRKAPTRVDTSLTPKIPKGQPTWCIRLTTPAMQIPAGLGDHGQRVYVPAGVPVRLVRVGTDDSGRQVWEVPADQWWCGDTVRIGPHSDDVTIRYGVYPPNTSNSYWKSRSHD